MPSIRPSTWAGTPATIVFGGVPSRAGQALRTRSWLPPMPPEVTITACARSSKSPTSTRLLALPRSTRVGSRTAPRTPTTVPPSTTSSSTRCRKANRIRPVATCSRTRRSNGATTPGPVPQVMWKRGTELPWPSARPSPRSAQPTTGKNRCPISRSQDALLAGGEVDVRLGPAARPVVLLAVELRAARASPAGQLAGVLDAHPALLGGVDEEQPAERPERLAAEGLLGLLVEQQHPLARRRRPRRRRPARPARPRRR